MTTVNPESIYAYSDYRQFLAELLEAVKKQNPNFSYRYFADKAGFSSHTYIQKIIRGERSLTEESIQKVCKGFKFSKPVQKYFTAMVRYNQAVDPNEKNRWYGELASNRKCVETFNLDRAHLNYYENWYYPVLRHLSIYLDWHGNYELLGACVDPPLTAQQAKKGIEDLLAMGLLQQNSDGSFGTASHSLSANNLPDFVKSRARIEIFKKSVESLTRFTPKERFTSCSLLSVSEATYANIIAKLTEAKEEVINMALNDKHPERAYQMVLQVFPCTKNWTTKESK